MTQRIGELLVEAGVLTQAQLDDALTRQVTEGETRIASELFQLGLAHERHLCEALCKQCGHPAVVLSESVVDRSALGLVPRVIAERNGILPITVDDNVLVVAVPDVEMGPILDQLQFASGRLVVPVLAVKTILDRTLGQAYDAFDQREPVWPGPHAAGREPFVAMVKDVPDVAQGPGPVEGAVAPPPLPPDEVPDAGAMSGAASAGVPLAQIDLVQLPVVREELPGPAAPAPAIEPVDVLVAEDDQAIANLIQRALAHDGYQVRVATTGDEAVQLLRVLRPRLILLDAMLPGVHGFDICSRVKRSEAFQGVPVVMISAVYKGWEHARDIQEVHGADAFIEKPFDVHFLRKMASSYLGGDLTRAPLAADLAHKVQRYKERFEEAYLHGEWQQAEASVTGWLSLDPFDGYAYLEMGNLASHRGDLPAAMHAYEVATVYAPESFSARTNLAMVYERLGFRRRAIDVWRAARQLAPDPQTVARIDERVRAL